MAKNIVNRNNLPILDFLFEEDPPLKYFLVSSALQLVGKKIDQSNEDPSEIAFMLIKRRMDEVEDAVKLFCKRYNESEGEGRIEISDIYHIAVGLMMERALTRAGVPLNRIRFGKARGYGRFVSLMSENSSHEHVDIREEAIFIRYGYKGSLTLCTLGGIQLEDLPTLESIDKASTLASIYLKKSGWQSR